MLEAEERQAGSGWRGGAHRPLLEPLLRSAGLPVLVDELMQAVEQESQQRREFIASLSEDVKAEFINGEKVVHSPSKWRHAEVSIRLAGLLRAFCTRRGLGKVTTEKTMVSLSRNDYEPDICLWKEERAAAFAPDQMRFPAPDFVVEILSPSTEKVDRGVKFEDFAAHGVGEYWIVDPEKESVEVYELAGATYGAARSPEREVLRSRVVEGFEIPLRALFDDAVHLEALREIVA